MLCGWAPARRIVGTEIREPRAASRPYEISPMVHDGPRILMTHKLEEYDELEENLFIGGRLPRGVERSIGNALRAGRRQRSRNRV